ncbi:MAG: exo-beta-N-acetylmuramidase NamZ family protein, partial [Bryobacteraceae bacterium]
EDQFRELRGRRVGLITNHTGLSRYGRRNVDLMIEAGVEIKALFSPEHGFMGREERDHVSHATDPATGLPVWSLYQGDNRRPSAEMLRDLDVLVFDIQDVGVRFYTYSCTMAYAMEVAAKRRIPFWVLDRPNPITGVRVEGPILEPELESFVGCFALPVRHGMTLGELARMINAERGWNASLRVIAMKGWERGDWFDSTGLWWTDPSPNMRNLDAALLYPGVALLESSREYSVGRGTDTPFQLIGAPWINGRELAEFLNRRYIPGIRVYPLRFTPDASRLSQVAVEGVRFVITDREAVHAVRLGYEVASALVKLYPGKLPVSDNQRLIGNKEVLRALEAGEDPRALISRDEAGIEEFLQRRARYLIYPAAGRGQSSPSIRKTRD